LVTLKIFGQTIIVACGYDTIEEMLVKHGEVTSGHPVDFGYTEYLELSGNREERKGVIRSFCRSWIHGIFGALR
jgi:hypothetical protein